MSDQIERHPGPWIGEDAEFARACAMAAVKDYGDDDVETHQRILKNGVWNDHVAVQAALAAIHNLRKAGLQSPLVWRNRVLTAERILLDILKANDEFRSGMPDDWEGDPLQDGCAAARAHLTAIGILPAPLSDTHRPTK